MGMEFSKNIVKEASLNKLNVNRFGAHGIKQGHVKLFFATQQENE